VEGGSLKVWEDLHVVQKRDRQAARGEADMDRATGVARNSRKRRGKMRNLGGGGKGARKRRKNGGEV